ncbi:FliM/FliN family flagellar motor switch protein, partial [bacterium]
MLNPEHQSVYNLESYLLHEAGLVVSNILGIRIHISPFAKKNINRVMALFDRGWVFHLKWRSNEGILKLYCDHRLMTEMLAIDENHIGLKDSHRVLHKYAHQFSEGFSQHLTYFMAEPWKVDVVDVKPFKNIVDIVQSSNYGRFYEIHTGTQLLNQVFTVADKELIQVWRDRLQKCEGEHFIEHYDDIKEIVPLISNYVQMPAQSQWLDSLEVELPVSAELGKTRIQLRKVLDLGPGDVVSLNKIDGDPVDLYINNQKFAEGRIIQAKGKIG